MEKHFSDPLRGFVVFWVGFHGIAIGMIANDGDRPGNLVWDLCVTFIRVELGILLVVLVIGVIGFIKDLFESDPDEKKSICDRKNILVQTKKHSDSNTQAEVALVVAIITDPEKTITLNPPPRKLKVKKAIPAPEEPLLESAAERKEKALKQIMRGY